MPKKPKEPPHDPAAVARFTQSLIDLGPYADAVAVYKLISGILAAVDEFDRDLGGEVARLPTSDVSPANPIVRLFHSPHEYRQHVANVLYGLAQVTTPGFDWKRFAVTRRKRLDPTEADWKRVRPKVEDLVKHLPMNVRDGLRRIALAGEVFAALEGRTDAECSEAASKAIR